MAMDRSEEKEMQQMRMGTGNHDCTREHIWPAQSKEQTAHLQP
jgi:hypothetical protein